MRIPAVAAIVALAAIVQEEAASPSRTQVRAIERGTGRVIDGATVERFAHEIRIFDAWWFRIAGDDLLRDPGEATAGAQAFTTINTGEGATIVASTPELRGARVFLGSTNPPPPFIDVEVGPRRSVDVIVLDAQGAPCAGAPVEFGRFLSGVPPRQHGDDPDFDDRCEIWDRLGARKVTDEQGRATLADLELHGIDDLDVLRGHGAGPFCARALVIGDARVCVPVDPDAPPGEPVVLKLPPITRVAAKVEMPNHKLVAIDGDAQVIARGRAAFAPGYPRFVEFRGGRAELFPVEVGGSGELVLATEVLDRGELTAMSIRVIMIHDGTFADDAYPRVEARLDLTAAAEREPNLTLTLPLNWFTLDARLLWSDGTPAADFEVECTRTFLRRRNETEEADVVEHPVRCELSSIRTDQGGRIHLLSHRPVVSGTFGLEFLVRSKEGICLDRKEVPVLFGTDLWHLDLGDVSFTMTPSTRR